MFRKVHLQLTLLCAFSTVLILCVFTAIYLSISEKNLLAHHELSFQHDMEVMLINLEQQTPYIHMNYLNTLEQSGGYLIYVWDNQLPYLHNSLTSHADNTYLMEEALTELKKQEKSTTWEGLRHPASIEYSLKGSNGIVYDVCAAYLPSEEPSGSQLFLLLLSSRLPLNRQIRNQRLLFVLFAALASLILSFFAWFFTGKLLRPIVQNQKLQSRFVASASHELRTPITVIRAGISAKAPGYEEMIQSECLRMGRLIDDMLLLTGMESQTPQLKKVSVEADTLLLNLYEQMEPLAAGKGLAMQIRLPDAPIPACHADKELLTQVLQILIQNAVQYTDAGGSITLSVFCRHSHTVFQVADTGMGISPEDKNRIFERFYRGDASHSQKGHFGLGLCIAKEIVEAHHGRIWVEDTPGGGSTFFVLL